jgi:lipoprotein-anchoring transpeptidase ErfK/SrfK
MKAFVIALAAAFFAVAAPAHASVILAKVNISTQRMEVFVNGAPLYTWPVSTAGRGYVTPVGMYHAQRMARMWYSRKYDNSPMPHSIFFKGGYAIHGTNHLKRLGTPASHGCVRLHPQNAATLFQLVQANGMGSIEIVVQR